MNLNKIALLASSMLAAASFSTAQQVPEKPAEPQPPKAAPVAPSSGSADTVPVADAAPAAVAPVAPVPAPPKAAVVDPTTGQPAIPYAGPANPSGVPGVLPTPGLAPAKMESAMEEMEPVEPGVDEAEEPLGEALMDEDLDLNVQKSMERYQSVIYRFDRQRANAAQAVFRLGECYRKLGRMEEAMVQYARILREFSEQQKLVLASQRYLFKKPGALSRENRNTLVISNNGSGLALVSPDGRKKILLNNGGSTLMLQAEKNKMDASASQIDALKQQLAQLQKQLAQRKLDGKPEDAYHGDKPTKEQLENQSKIETMERNLEDLDSELAVAKENVASSRQRLTEAQNKLHSAGRAKPELLPPPADADSQYKKFREEYLAIFLAEPENKERVQNLYKRLQDYVEKVYVPALSEANEAAADLWVKARNDVLMLETEKKRMLKAMTEAKAGNEKR